LFVCVVVDKNNETIDAGGCGNIANVNHEDVDRGGGGWWCV
jgi:hypothetical protein